jgi:hypothetical protein
VEAPVKAFAAIAALLFLVAIAVACGASFNGPATSSANERCKGYLDCGAAGCCMEANEANADQYDCLPPNAMTANGHPRGPCVFVGSIVEMGAELADAGADADAKAR